MYVCKCASVCTFKCICTFKFLFVFVGKATPVGALPGMTRAVLTQITVCVCVCVCVCVFVCLDSKLEHYFVVLLPPLASTCKH